MDLLRFCNERTSSTLDDQFIYSKHLKISYSRFLCSLVLVAALGQQKGAPRGFPGTIIEHAQQTLPPPRAHRSFHSQTNKRFSPWFHCFRRTFKPIGIERARTARIKPQRPRHPFWHQLPFLVATLRTGKSANILDYSPSVTPNQEAMDPRQVGVERRAELEAEYNRRQADAGRVEWRIATGKLAEMPTRPPGQPSRLLTEVAQRL